MVLLEIMTINHRPLKTIKKIVQQPFQVNHMGLLSMLLPFQRFIALIQHRCISQDMACRVQTAVVTFFNSCKGYIWRSIIRTAYSWPQCSHSSTTQTRLATPLPVSAHCAHACPPWKKRLTKNEWNTLFFVF